MPRQRTNVGRAAALVMTAVVLAGCGSAPVAPERLQQSEQQLLRPFARDQVVGCSELDIACTANFNRNVGQPAVDPQFHQVTKRQVDGATEVVWTNLTGNASNAFVVTVGPTAEFTDQGLVQPARTTFRVVNQVRFRVYEGKHALALEARASGDFVFVQDADGKPREVREFAIVDGTLRTP